MDMRQLFLISLLVALSLSKVFGQTPQMFLIPQKAAAGGGGLTFISTTATAFNSTTSPKTTSSISVNSGDILVAIGMCVNTNSGNFTLGVSGGSLTWTNQQEISESLYAPVALWTATASSTTSITVSFTNSDAERFGGIVYVIRGSSGGVGASAKTNVSSGAPSLALTTTVNGSWIITASADWNAGTGSRTWRTINSITPTGGNNLERLYSNDPSQGTYYSGYWNGVGTAGSKTTGLSAPGSQKYSIIALEIKP